MKLQGSRKVRMKCLKCSLISEPFYVTLADDEEDGDLYFPKTVPQGWLIPDDEALEDDVLNGYCPQHIRGMMKTCWKYYKFFVTMGLISVAAGISLFLTGFQNSEELEKLLKE